MQSLFGHNEPGGDYPAVPRSEQLHRQHADVPGSLSRLGSAGRSQWRGEREMMMMRWAFPPAPFVKPPLPITNARHLDKNYWTPWLDPAHRGLVPATSFSEFNDVANPKTLKNPDGSPHGMAGKKDVVCSRCRRNGRCLLSPACGDRGAGLAAPSQSRPKEIIRSTPS